MKKRKKNMLMVIIAWFIITAILLIATPGMGFGKDFVIYLSNGYELKLSLPFFISLSMIIPIVIIFVWQHLKCCDKSNKKAIITVFGVFVSLLLIMGVGYYYYGIGMSSERKSEIINSVLSDKNYDKARNLTKNYFKGNDEISQASRELHLNIIDTCEEFGTGSLNETINQAKELAEYVNTIQILKTQVKSGGSYSNYSDVEITIKNTGKKSVSYVKIGVDYKDLSGNIIQSDWTINDSIIKPNATQTLSLTVSKDIGFDKVDAEVINFR